MAVLLHVVLALVIVLECSVCLPLTGARRVQTVNTIDSKLAVPSPKFINGRIIQAFQLENVRNSTELNGLRQYLQSNLASMNEVNAITLMHRCARIKKNVTAFIPLSGLIAVLQRGCPNAQGVANALYSLHAIDETHPDFPTLLFTLDEKLNMCRDVLDGQAIANSLYGLKNTNPSMPYVLQILLSIQRQMARTASSMSTASTSQGLVMNAQGLGCAFIGMQHMGGNGTHPIVRSLLRSLSETLSRSSASNEAALDGQAFANILASLKTYSSNAIEVRLVLAALTKHVSAYPACLTTIKSRELSMSLWGLQGAEDIHTEVLDILDIILAEMVRPTSSFRYAKTAEVLFAIGGLRRLSDRTPVVKNLLRLLSAAAVESLKGGVEGVNEIAVGSAVIGLQSMYASSEALEAIAAVSRVVNTFNVTLSDRAVASALYGLQNMNSSSKQVRYMLKTLVKHANIDKTDTPIDHSPHTHTFDATAHMGMMLYGMQNMKNDCPEVAGVLNMVIRLLAESPVSMCPQTIANAFFGLQNMDDSPAVRKLCVVIGLKLERCTGTFSGQEVGMMLQGLRGIGSDSQSIRDVLDWIADEVRATSHMSWSEVCMALNGLQSMGGGKTLYNNMYMEETDIPSPMALSASDVSARESVDGRKVVIPPYALDKALSSSGVMGGVRKKSLLPAAVNNLLLSLIDKMDDAIEQAGYVFSPSSVASAIYGLQGLSADSASVKRILVTLTYALRASFDSAPLDGQSIGNILFALQNMTTRSYQVRRLLVVVAEGISTSNCTINPQVVGNALYGMQGFSSDVSEVRKVLRALVDKASLMPVEEHMFTGQNIGNSLWGLRNMSAECTQVRRMLRCLIPHFQHSSVEMSGQNLGNALYALNRMSDAHIEVRQMLAVLAFKLIQSNYELSGLDIGMALFGLRNMRKETSEVQVILGILLHKIKTSKSTLQLSDLSLAIVGLLGSASWIKDDFMKVLASRTPGMSIQLVDDHGATASGHVD